MEKIIFNRVSPLLSVHFENSSSLLVLILTYSSNYGSYHCKIKKTKVFTVLYTQPDNMNVQFQLTIDIQ